MVDGRKEGTRMKLLHIATARTIWLFNLLDLNPRGQAFTQETIDKISEKYKFKGPPTISAALAAQQKNEAIYFAAGEFMSTSGINVVVDLKVYNDGLIADCRSNTKDGEMFLADLLSWIPAGLNLPKVEVPVRKKLYVSELNVETDHQLLMMINPKLAKLSDLLATVVPPGSATSYEVAGLALATDPKDGAPLTNFRFERLVKSPFAENRYFTAAPVQTDDHLKLIESLEEILTG
jgi:hypothetical protein